MLIETNIVKIFYFVVFIGDFKTTIRSTAVFYNIKIRIIFVHN